jgi:hypothetical protein
MTTYSLAITGAPADQTFGEKTLDVPDSVIGSTYTIASATVGGMQNCMRQGLQVLCKGPDGGQHWYAFDAERSTAANPVLKYIGP